MTTSLFMFIFHFPLLKHVCLFDAFLSAIGVNDKECSIKKLGTNTYYTVTGNKCVIGSTFTGFWISINEAANQIRLGRQDETTHFFNLWDQSTGERRISNIQYIGVKTHDAEGGDMDLAFTLQHW